ncbi:MAG: hypothetical protein WD690_00840 [Vicinamibacterales bacterium]
MQLLHRLGPEVLAPAARDGHGYSYTDPSGSAMLTATLDAADVRQIVTDGGSKHLQWRIRQKQIAPIERQIERQLRTDLDGAIASLLGLMAGTGSDAAEVRETCSYLITQKVGARAEAALTRTLESATGDLRAAVEQMLFDFELNAALEPDSVSLSPPTSNPGRLPAVTRALEEITSRIAAAQREKRAMEEKNPFVGSIMMGIGPVPPDIEKKMEIANRDFESVRLTLDRLWQAKRRLEDRATKIKGDGPEP